MFAWYQRAEARWIIFPCSLGKTLSHSFSPLNTRFPQYCAFDICSNQRRFLFPFEIEFHGRIFQRLEVLLEVFDRLIGILGVGFLRINFGLKSWGRPTSCKIRLQRLNSCREELKQLRCWLIFFFSRLKTFSCSCFLNFLNRVKILNFNVLEVDWFESHFYFLTGIDLWKIANCRRIDLLNCFSFCAFLILLCFHI